MKPYSVRPPLSAAARSELAPYSDVVAHLLYHRGVATSEEAARFVLPDYDRDLHDPFLLKDMERSVERILRAVRANERIVVYSDYDTDGIPAAVALNDFFRKIGFGNFRVYIPHRHDEGFGLNIDAVDEFAVEKASVIITIDCGIGDILPVARAKDHGIDVIITDHHVPGQVLPPAYAIVNPKQEGCSYPEKMLCGAGVIYKVIQATAIEGKRRGLFDLTEGWEKWLLDMVGVATLSDMVPLKGENRALAHYGLTVLRKSPRLGLSRLLSIARAPQATLTEEDVGFTIGPRINAASRMGVPHDAFTLLSTRDHDEADHYARHLDRINNERKGVVASLAKEIKRTLAARTSHLDRNVIVIGNPLWRPALLGLAANACAEEYGKPFFIWGRDGDGVIKGSCRAGGMVNLLDLMKAVPPGILIQYGGHAFSGGFSVEPDAIHDLEGHLETAYQSIAVTTSKAPEYIVDAELSIDLMTDDLYRDIQRLAPFGTGNPKPLFAFPNVSLTGVKQFGKEGNHLQLSIATSRRPLSAVGFYMARPDLEVGSVITLLGNVERSTFMGRSELRLRIVDIL